MEDVTDTAFRELVMQLSDPGRLHILFTEFTSTDGMCHPIGRPKVAHRLKVTNSERELLNKLGIKLVAQIWGNKPEKFAETIRHLEENYAFDGIDINMGCPAKNVVSHGSCSALIDNESLAGEIIQAAHETCKLPLSVKTRLGVRHIETERWMSFLLKQPIDALIVHGRIQKQMSDGEANWEEIGKAVKLRNELAPHIKLVGNGDVETVPEAYEKCTQYGTDGVMIGRGIFKNPWMFSPEIAPRSPGEKMEALRNHMLLFEKAWQGERPFVMLRRFFKIYASGFEGASDLRNQLMQATNYSEVHQILNSFNY